MKSFFLLCAVLALAAAAIFVPLGGKTLWARAQERGLPRAAARFTARELRAGWNFIAGLGQHGSAQRDGHDGDTIKMVSPARSQEQMARRPGREGILPQPPKEKLQKSDRDALDKLLTRGR